MAIKAGQIIHDGYGFVIDRIQTGGASGLNIPEEKVYEVGNFQAVATVRDTPDLTFGMESFDASTEIEALLTGFDPTNVVSGQAFDLATSVPMDIVSPLKDSWNIYTAARGIIIPYLTLERSAYRFDLKGNSSQNQSMRGDSYFFVDGSPYYEEWPGDGASTSFAFKPAHGPAIPYNYLGKVHYLLGLSVVYSDNTFKRLFLDSEYTNTATGFELLDPSFAPAGSTLRGVYGTKTVVTYPQSVHATTDVKPAAIRGKSIDIYLGTRDATPTFTRLTSVQSAEINWSVTLDRDEEFGNAQAVSQDHDVPEVAGNVAIRPRDVKELYDRIFTVAGVPLGEVAGPLTSVGLPIEVRLSDPDTGQRLKTFYVPDARFRLPNIESRVQEKLNLTFEWTSDGGSLTIFDGERP